MTESLLAWAAIVAVAIICVRAVAALSPSADLQLLPLHKRHRVEWCAAHYREVERAGAVLVAVLAILSVLAATV